MYQQKDYIILVYGYDFELFTVYSKTLKLIYILQKCRQNLHEQWLQDSQCSLGSRSKQSSKKCMLFYQTCQNKMQTEFWIHKYFDQFRVCSIGNLEKHLRRHFTLRLFKHVKTSISNFQNKQSALLLAKSSILFPCNIIVLTLK